MPVFLSGDAFFIIYMANRMLPFEILDESFKRDCMNNYWLYHNQQKELQGKNKLVKE